MPPAGRRHTVLDVISLKPHNVLYRTLAKRLALFYYAY